MSILAIGLSHRTADLATLERVAVPAAEVGKVLHELQQADDVSEVMLLSTCNRIEVYAVVETFHGGLASIADVLARQAGMETAELYDHFYVHYAGAAVEHVFSVASGLDSMVVGETQILGQVRTAYATARETGTVGSTLHELIQTTLRVGKRVHTETGLDRLGASVVSEALAAAGELSGRRALVVGAGSMGALATSQLRKGGIAEIVVINRTPERAARLVSSLTEQGVTAKAAPMAELADEVARADVVVVCTGAKNAVLGTEHVAPRADRPVVVCDLGLPRDVEPEVGSVPGVTLVDLETVRKRMAESGTATTDKQLAKASGIILDEVRAYLAGQRSAAVTPTVTALRKRAAEVVDAELLRLDRRLPDLDADVRDELGRTVRRVVDKLLHTPTVRVKQLAAEKSGTDYANALRELFGLDPQVPTVVSSPSAASQHDQIDGDHSD
ncbi:glutamyl-tRNA reductase [Saccharomonospora viridis]|jgi:glutamyl-tRNA reductase|uniref:Glutamyl-tRNA reductase n=2 Tax=Saccharomonospora viridis TaxID=1852 RepID=C7MT06_SACVD|nr:glutamyl-tRNA reductase [Saccharomonospora viridis]ACU95367.1 glutamyl-tRNA reductase [Saccharomonospora viridis DSM 43017]KHF44999.1 glutamyl-tRNA reductase [Saccharomonospora viridis]SFP15899.1 glutamyl-tRNA reductase [Saccharomonospora viridis]